MGLWTRLERFDPAELAGLLTERAMVRTPAMRTTIHLFTARDCLALRPLFDGLLARTFASSAFDVGGVDLDALTAEAVALLEQRPRTRGELGGLLARTRPDSDPLALSYALQHLLPLVLRYLAAFGPATVADIQLWSGLTKLREVVEELDDRLLELRGENGAVLFDLPDALRPDPDTPAPPRFLPEYDNVLLSHADRSRVNPEGRRVPLPPGNGAAPRHPAGRRHLQRRLEAGAPRRHGGAPDRAVQRARERRHRGRRARSRPITALHRRGRRA